MKCDPKQFGKVAVLMGGEFAEREVSLMSGNSVMEALQTAAVDAHAVDVGPNICEHLLANDYDRAFIAMHGTLGEDGTLQGMLEYLKIPYTGSNVLSSALAMDKEKSKLVWKALGLPTLPFKIIDDTTTFAELKTELGLPLAIKPNAEGSSVGITRVEDASEFKDAFTLANQSRIKVMVEPWLDTMELTVGIVADKVLPVIRIATPVGFYDYQAKYFSDDTEYHIPSGLSVKQEKQVQELSLQAYKALDCRHWGRVDLLMDENKNIWLLEINTIPGLTSHSLVPKAAKAIGMDFQHLQ